MERAAVLCKGEAVGSSLLGSFLLAESEARESDADRLNLDRSVLRLERRLILDALAVANDDKGETAKLLGIGERTLWTKLKKHDL